MALSDWHKGQMQAGKSMYWQTVVWFCDDFTPDDLSLFCDALDIPCAYIVHDKDVFGEDDVIREEKRDRGVAVEVGKPKKLHAHLLLAFCSQKTHNQVAEELDYIGERCNYWVERCKDWASCQRYLCHLSHPSKAQYAVEDVECFCGFEYSPTKKLTAEAKAALVPELVRFIREENIGSYAVLCNWVCFNRPDLIPIAMHDYAYALKCVCESVAARKRAQDAPDSPAEY